MKVDPQPAGMTSVKNNVLKRLSDHLFKSPKIFFESPSEIVVSTPPTQIFDAQALELKVKDNELNNLAVTWIAARQKARRYKTRRYKMKPRRDKAKTGQKEEFSEHAKVVIDWFYDPPYAPPTYRSPLTLNSKRRQECSTNPERWQAKSIGSSTVSLTS